MKVKLKFYLLSIYVWGFFILTVLPLFLLLLVLWMVLTPVDKQRRITHFYSALWGKLYLFINPWWHIIITDKKKLDPGQTCIIISNHQSLLDIPILMQLFVHFRWVSKIELFSAPVIGWVSRMNKYIPVQRGHKESVYYMMEACKDALENGISVFIFPEGTRTEDGTIKPFREGAFVLAKETNSAILPVVIDGASSALPKKGILFRGKQTIRVKVLDYIPVEEVKQLNLHALMDKAHEILTTELGLLRKMSTN